MSNTDFSPMLPLSYPDPDPWIGDVYRPKEQRAALFAFAIAIGARRRLGEDEAGNPRLEGAHGRVYVMPSTCDPGRTPKYQLVMLCDSEQRWRHAKEAMQPFAKVTNNSPNEGILVLARLPTAQEGEIIRDKLGIGKKRVLSEQDLSRLRTMGFKAKKPHDGDDPMEGHAE